MEGMKADEGPRCFEEHRLGMFRVRSAGLAQPACRGRWETFDGRDVMSHRWRTSFCTFALG
jgi:hypothetical protein